MTDSSTNDDDDEINKDDFSKFFKIGAKKDDSDSKAFLKDSGFVNELDFVKHLKELDRRGDNLETEAELNFTMGLLRKAPLKSARSRNLDLSSWNSP